MSKKEFFKMTLEERDAESKKWESGVSFEDTSPMSKRSQALWQIAKRGRGRPQKPASEKVRRVLISIEPSLLALIETFTASKGLDRSKLFSISVRAFIEAENAIQKASSERPLSTRQDRIAEMVAH
jgi:hypothetical protein